MNNLQPNNLLPQHLLSENLSANGELPLVSVVMPIRNEANYIEQSLGMVLAQDYPHDKLEILVADGGSTDGTRQIIHKMQLDHPQIHLIDNPGKIVPTGLNIAIQQARGEVIVRIDGHAVVDPDYVRQCILWLQKSGADCVGGAMISKGHGYIGEAIALAMSSPLGVGGSGFRVASPLEEPHFTDTVPFGAYRRDVFSRVGLFNEKMIRHQDYEFCYRLRQAGGQILLLPQVRTSYYVRSTVAALWQQYWQYGLWKGRFLRQHPASLKLRHLVPPLFVLSVVVIGLSTIVFSWGFRLLTCVLVLYSLFIIVAVIKLSFNMKTLKYSLILPVILICLHISWGFGVWRGLFSRMK